MLSVRPVASLALITCLPLAGAVLPGEPSHGATLFQSQKCVGCHSLNGKGGTAAPDLAKTPGGRYTPSMMAAAMWNHAPQMWQAMEAAGIAKPVLSPEDAADLFALFYAYRYFERSGDAGHGKQVFESKGCAGCHVEKGTAPPVARWDVVADSIQLARAMWNHAAQMKTPMGGKAWPTLTAQEMADIVVYARNQPGARKQQNRFAPASAATGEILFKEKGCVGCHTGAMALRGKVGGQTPAGMAAAMWNHAPQMRDKAKELRPEEMTRLVGYLWSLQYFDPSGDPAKGSEVARSKGCTSCHGTAGSVAPDFRKLAGKMDAITFASQTWKHGPAMLNQMKQAKVVWPRFENNELSDLLAYINSI